MKTRWTSGSDDDNNHVKHKQGLSLQCNEWIN